jgi:precorrin-6x reductase
VCRCVFVIMCCARKGTEKRRRAGQEKRKKGKNAQKQVFVAVCRSSAYFLFIYYIACSCDLLDRSHPFFAIIKDNKIETCHGAHMKLVRLKK